MKSLVDEFEELLILQFEYSHYSSGEMADEEYGYPAFQRRVKDFIERLKKLEGK